MRFLVLVAAVCSLLATGCGAPVGDTERSDTAETPAAVGPYLGQEPPGDEPVLFAPGVLSTSLHDDCPAVFSADGREVWFRKWAVPHDIVGHMRMDDDGVWSEPELFRPDGDCIFLHPVFIPGKDLALLSGFRPAEPGADAPEQRGVWEATYRDGRWTDWRWSELNVAPRTIVWSVANDGTAYLQVTDPDGGGTVFHSARRVDGGWEEPVLVDIPLDGDGVAPTIAPDGSYLVYTMRSGPGGLGGGDLYVSFRRDDGSWTAPRNVGEPVNSATDDKFSAFSPDGAYFFYVSGRAPERQRTYLDLTYAELVDMNEGPRNGLGRGDVYWVSAEVIRALAPH